MGFSSESPFFGAVPPTVQLPNTPLTGVVVQISFHEVRSIATAEFIANFQEHIRADYPSHKKEKNLVLQLTADGVKSNSNFRSWHFFDLARDWRLSLTTNFIALKTRSYQSRQDFARRTKAVVRALSTTVNPEMMTRIGIRYVDQIHGPRFKQLSRFVRPEILGLYIGDYQQNLSRTQNEIAGKTDVGLVSSRWGLMPANETHEPNLMPPIAEPSWFLDIDVYKDFAQPALFEVDRIETSVIDLATRAYGFFRWMVNDEFLRACGGDI